MTRRIMMMMTGMVVIGVSGLGGMGWGLISDVLMMAQCRLLDLRCFVLGDKGELYI